MRASRPQGTAAISRGHRYPVVVNGGEIIFVVEDAPEGGYQARALGHSIFTEADSLDELREMVRDAVACHFEDGDRPSVIRLHVVKDELLAT